MRSNAGTRVFKRELDAHLDPHEVVALGAALQAHALTATRSSTGRMEVPPAPLPDAKQMDSTGKTEWRQKTQPFGRLGTTNIGVGQTRPQESPENIQVPPPDEVNSRPIPTTKHLGSRGRLNTAVGMGPTSEPRTYDNNLEPEDLLPVVAGTSRNLVGQDSDRGGQVGAHDAFAESDDEEATAVRVYSEPAADSDSNLPMPMVEFQSVTNDAAQGDDITVRVQRKNAESTTSESPYAIQGSSSSRVLPDERSDLDLPAIVTTGAAGSAKVRSSPAPSSGSTKHSIKISLRR